MKQVIFMGDALAQIRSFPPGARQDAGFQIDKVQRDELPDEWKPMKSIGKGVREIRIKEASGQYRVIYLTRLKDSVYVLHAFQKKTRQTRKSDIDLARKRLREIGV
ncbi:MAG: type II toxin-antitoxin system RelE/ParE family toxin [Xanthomonadales bacterium]|nr:type II toxin-antitoxin system RelE/ParE family toxin [Xanthomonadales bacterium]